MIQIWTQYFPYKRGSVTLNKSIINYLHKLNDQNQVFRFLFAIWPKSKDLYPTYLRATKPPSV